MNTLLKLTTVLLTFALLLSNCNSDTSSSYYDSGTTYEETKMSLENQEKLNPISFLSTEGTYRKNLLGEWVLEGSISNTATVAQYKDVVLEIKFYSKTETLLGTEREVIYEYFSAGRMRDFKIKTYGYKGTNSIGWDIVGASAVD